MATVLDTPVSVPGLWPVAEPKPLRAVLGVADLGETAGRLALVAGLKVLRAEERMVTLGDPASDQPLLVLVPRAVRAEDAPVLCRLTFVLDLKGDVARAVSVARRHGAVPLRALRDDRMTEAHVTGPGGMELGFVHRTEPADLEADAAPLAFSPGTLGGRPGEREGRIRLEHVVLATRTGEDRRVLRTSDGRVAGLVTRRDDLVSTVPLLSIG